MMSGEQKDVDTVPLGVLVFVIVLQPCLEVKACDGTDDNANYDENEEEAGRGSGMDGEAFFDGAGRGREGRGKGKNIPGGAGSLLRITAD